MKITYELSSEELKSAIELWMGSKSPSIIVTDKDTFQVDAVGNVTIVVASSENGSVISVVPKIPVAPVILTPIPIPPVPVAHSGHIVTEDPPLSATGKATMFGLDWGGGNDSGDNRIGFFNDPSTGRHYNTGLKTLPGASLPREILLSSFGICNDWLKPEITDHYTSGFWQVHALSVQKYVSDHKVTLDIDSGGLSAVDVPLVDAGPLAVGENGSTIGNLVDLTYFTAHSLNTKGDATATIRLKVDGVVVPIVGWNSVTKRVG